jgi:hypothetical protein
MNIVILIIILILALTGMATIAYITYTKPATCTLASDPCDDKLPCCDKNYSCQSGTCEIKPNQPLGTERNVGCINDGYILYGPAQNCCTNTSSFAFTSGGGAVCIPFGTTPAMNYPAFDSNQVKFPKYCSNVNEQCVPGSEYPYCSYNNYCKLNDDGTSYCVDAGKPLTPS